MAKSSVMRLANSADTSSCLNCGSSPVLDLEIVGSASSSVTPGSSIARVAGKKRLPTISWARVFVAEAARLTARAAKGHEFLSMGNSSIAVTVRPRVAAKATSGEDGRTSSKAGVDDNVIVRGGVGRNQDMQCPRRSDMGKDGRIGTQWRR